MSSAKVQETDRDRSKTGRLFTESLLRWNLGSNKRKMPWKGETDPYRIWLSEIILQQTRVEQGLKYYENFTRTFPDIHALANAPEEAVFKAWEGLGYYSRCRNLVAAARFISANLDGIFPSSYEDILELKGVGPYTAAAIASFAYNLPHAVLDGNVFRVLSRIFNIETPIDTSPGKIEFTKLARQILPPGKAGIYNQAIMDFGATICKPVPECMNCFFRANCKAFKLGNQNVLPVKSKKLIIKKRWLNYFIIQFGDEIAVRQRTLKDIWQQLYEYVLVETDRPHQEDELMMFFEKEFGITDYQLVSTIVKNQKLTHQSIQFSFYKIIVDARHDIPGYSWVKKKHLSGYAFPKTLQQFANVNA